MRMTWRNVQRVADRHRVEHDILQRKLVEEMSEDEYEAFLDFVEDDCPELGVNTCLSKRLQSMRPRKAMEEVGAGSIPTSSSFRGFTLRDLDELKQRLPTLRKRTTSRTVKQC